VACGGQSHLIGRGICRRQAAPVRYQQVDWRMAAVTELRILTFSRPWARFFSTMQGYAIKATIRIAPLGTGRDAKGGDDFF
jgi:hypothetical protein